MSTAAFPIDLEHRSYGSCRLLRVEGMNWVVEVGQTRTQLRIPATRRAEFIVVEVKSVAATPSEIPPRREGFFDGGFEPSQPIHDNALNEHIIPHPPVEPATIPVQVSTALPHDKIKLRKAIESMRNGLPPVSVEAHRLAVGLENLETHLNALLDLVGQKGGAVKIVRGTYGQGKTLSLNLAAELALQKGFWVAQTEVDASERRLDKPSNIYRGLMQSLRVPALSGRGCRQLAAQISSIICQRFEADTSHYSWNTGTVYTWLRKELQCRPLAWLLSDPDLPKKEMLCALLEGDRGFSLPVARRTHKVPGGPADWPRFDAGSQGDFACFLLSGLGRLARLLGYRGLVVILDEMEKWEDLSWNQQTRAGNLIGGLIWGATEQEGRRERKSVHQPEALQHSARAGGFPFTTLARAHLGLIIALTPRGDDGPEELWGEFGPIDIFDLPEFTQANFSAYIATASTLYTMAYDLPHPQVAEVSCRARMLWREFGDGSARMAVRATIQALDEWRDSLNV